MGVYDHIHNDQCSCKYGCGFIGRCPEVYDHYKRDAPEDGLQPCPNQEFKCMYECGFKDFYQKVCDHEKKTCKIAAALAKTRRRRLASSPVMERLAREIRRNAQRHR